mmetsp:Transcript_50746/g.110810  ORF Transcript_50746/g.110810 Transcript_50746/m.110810 type:complete len:227 (+) Transcript_50746:84-764(+)
MAAAVAPRRSLVSGSSEAVRSCAKPSRAATVSAYSNFPPRGARMASTAASSIGTRGNFRPPLCAPKRRAACRVRSGLRSGSSKRSAARCKRRTQSAFGSRSIPRLCTKAASTTEEHSGRRASMLGANLERRRDAASLGSCPAAPVRMARSSGEGSAPPSSCKTSCSSVSGNILCSSALESTGRKVGAGLTGPSSSLNFSFCKNKRCSVCRDFSRGERKGQELSLFA